MPQEWVRRLDAVLGVFPRCAAEPAWVGTRWRVGSATVAHVFGGEDGLFRIVFRADPDEVMALQHLGDPYFKASWGSDVVGLLLDDEDRAFVRRTPYGIRTRVSGVRGQRPRPLDERSMFLRLCASGCLSASLATCGTLASGFRPDQIGAGSFRNPP